MAQRKPEGRQSLKLIAFRGLTRLYEPDTAGSHLATMAGTPLQCSLRIRVINRRCLYSESTVKVSNETRRVY